MRFSSILPFLTHNNNFFIANTDLTIGLFKKRKKKRVKKKAKRKKKRSLKNLPPKLLKNQKLCASKESLSRSKRKNNRR